NLAQCFGQQRVVARGCFGVRILCVEIFGVGVDEGGIDDAGHHITSISAWIAPAALIACRMPIKSRGPIPRPLRPSTSCCSETPSFTTANFLPSSETATLLRGVTTVRPRDSGLGWLTCGASEIVTVRLPCATATVF